MKKGLRSPQPPAGLPGSPLTGVAVDPAVGASGRSGFPELVVETEKEWKEQ